MQETFPSLSPRNSDTCWTLVSDTLDKVVLSQHYIWILIEYMQRQIRMTVNNKALKNVPYTVTSNLTNGTHVTFITLVMEYNWMVYIGTAAKTALAKPENSSQYQAFKEHIWSPRNSVKDWNYDKSHMVTSLLVWDLESLGAWFLAEGTYNI